MRNYDVMKVMENPEMKIRGGWIRRRVVGWTPAQFAYVGTPH